MEASKEVHDAWISGIGEGVSRNSALAAVAVVLPEPDMNEEGYIPCPFCGSNHVSLSTGEKADGEPWYYVECDSCTATAEPEKWNERAQQAQGGE